MSDPTHPTALELESMPGSAESHEKVAESNSTAALATSSGQPTGNGPYKLYKRRFAGLIGIMILNGMTAMSWPWFGPIANGMTDEFGITLNQVNWLGNILQCIYLPAALLTPVLCSRIGIRRVCDIGAVLLLISAWVRYAGTSRSLSTNQSYALLILGQFFAAIVTPIYQVLGPKYSERWFGLGGRTTATMILAISYPVGGAIGQLLSPLVGTPRESILVLGIISSAATPFVFLIGEAPPTPPSLAGTTSLSLSSLVRALLGVEKSEEALMTRRERLDFMILAIVFGAITATTNVWSIFTDQYLAPAGYSSDTAGFMGATLLLSGIVAAIITAPLFDRVFTSHLAITIKIFVPCVAICWLSLIWAVKPHNLAGLYALMVLIGIFSVPLLPVALELGCELTRNADGSSAILWFICNLMGIVFLLIEEALRAGPDASPPLNMRTSLIFQGCILVVTGSFVFLIKGKQVRKEKDVRAKEESDLAAQSTA